VICSSISTNAQNKKVVILDSLQSKKIITQLIQGNVAKAENKIYRQMDSVLNDRIKTLYLANENLLKAFDEKQSEVNQYKESVKLQQKVIKKEKNKKNIWKTIAVSISVGASYLLFVK
jgi:hypothetical protein